MNVDNTILNQTDLNVLLEMGKNKKLYYNSDKKTFEVGNRRNGFVEFLKTIFLVNVFKYNVRGYSSNFEKVITGLNDKISKLDEMENPSPEFLESLEKVRDTALPLLAPHASGSKKMAVEAQQLKIDRFVAKHRGGEQQKAEVSKEDRPKKGSSTSHKEPILQQKGEAVIPQDNATPVPTPAPAFTPPPVVGGPPPPPPPPMLTPEAKKAQNIEKTKKEIGAEEVLVLYLELLEMKKSEAYKNYANAQSNLNVFLGKDQEQVLFDKYEHGIQLLEESLQSSNSSSIKIKQNGEEVVFDRKDVVDTLTEWKQKRQEILNTRKKVAEYNKQVGEASQGMIEFKGEKITCLELDQRIADLEKKIPANQIEENKGLKFHQNNLFNLRNKLRKLNGEKVSEKRGKSKPRLFAMGLNSHADGKGAARALATAALKKQHQKAERRPSLEALFASQE